MIGVEADTDDMKEAPGFIVLEGMFLLIFASELSLYLYGFGWIYFQDPWHWLDAVVVAVSVVDFIISIAARGGGGAGLSAVRLLRVVRVCAHTSPTSSLSLRSLLPSLKALHAHFCASF